MELLALDLSRPNAVTWGLLIIGPPNYIFDDINTRSFTTLLSAQIAECQLEGRSRLARCGPLVRRRLRVSQAEPKTRDSESRPRTLLQDKGAPERVNPSRAARVDQFERPAVPVARSLQSCGRVA